jgi:hypothetical protein
VVFFIRPARDGFIQTAHEPTDISQAFAPMLNQLADLSHFGSRWSFHRADSAAAAPVRRHWGFVKCPVQRLAQRPKPFGAT